MAFLATENENRQLENLPLCNWKSSPVDKDQVNDWEFCVLKITPIFLCLCSVSTHFFILSQSANALHDFILDCQSSHFNPFIKLTLLVSKGLLCLYGKQNNTWLLVDTKFLFSCWTRHPTRSLRSLASYRVKHSEKNSIFWCAHVLSSIHLYPKLRYQQLYIEISIGHPIPSKSTPFSSLSLF